MAEQKSMEMTTNWENGGLFDDAKWNSPTAVLKRDSSMASTVNPQTKSSPEGSSSKLGTATGVFLPCVQNIVGIILFLRLPWITAQAGTWYTSLLLVCSVGSTFLTTLSLSAICTNGKIPSGGPYFVISRNLGLPVGCSIGIMFYLGTTFAASMYCLGAAEALAALLGSDLTLSSMDMQWQSILLCFLLGFIVYVGVEYVNMASFAFLCIVFLSIFSATLGLILNMTGLSHSLLPEQLKSFDNMFPAYTEDPATGITPTFASLLALLYPSVTGCLAGINRSGVLKNPANSIPSGTLAAIGSTFLLYLGFIWLFGGTISNATLKEDKLILSLIAWPHPVVVKLGIMFSSVGAALQSFSGAPRILAAIANDDALPMLQYFRIAEGQEPRKAVLFTCLLAALPCLAGNLDFISPFVTLFMLLMYLCINFACFVMSVLKAPGFRPTWHYYSWGSALLGMLWCLALMLLISWYQALCSVVLVVLLWFWASARGASKDWGSALKGIKFEVACRSLLSMENAVSKSTHVKNWRPQLLVLVDIDAEGHPYSNKLLYCGSQLKKGRGLLQFIGLLESNDTNENVADTEKATRNLQKAVHIWTDSGFANVYVTKNRLHGLHMAVQSSGIGPLKCNTVLVGWPTRWKTLPECPMQYTELLRSIISSRKSLMVLKDKENHFPANTKRLEGTIDVWWLLHDGGLLMLIPYLLQLHKVWRGCKLRLFTVALETDNSIDVKRRLELFMENLRIQATVHVVEMNETDLGNIVSQRTLDMVAGRALVQKLKSNTLSTVYREDTPPKKPLHELFAALPDVSIDMTDDKRHSLGWKEDTKDEEENEFESIDSSRMEQAVRMNLLIVTHSHCAKVVVMNLPRAKKVVPTDFMEYVEVLTENLDCVLLLRGNGAEVVTTYG